MTSNLKSESADRIAERFPGISADEQRLKMLEQRLRGLFGESEGDAHFSAGVPPQKDPADIFLLLHAVADQLAPPPADAYPRVVTAPLLQRLPVDPLLRSYLWELDGTRDLDEVTSFAPAPPEDLDRALRVCFALGVIIDSGKATTLTTVVGADGPSATEIFPGGWETALPPRKAPKASNKSLALDDLFGEEEESSHVVEDPIRKWFGSHHDRIRTAADHFAKIGRAHV